MLLRELDIAPATILCPLFTLLCSTRALLADVQYSSRGARLALFVVRLVVRVLRFVHHPGRAETAELAVVNDLHSVLALHFVPAVQRWTEEASKVRALVFERFPPTHPQFQIYPLHVQACDSPAQAALHVHAALLGAATLEADSPLAEGAAVQFLHSMAYVTTWCCNTEEGPFTPLAELFSLHARLRAGTLRALLRTAHTPSAAPFLHQVRRVLSPGPSHLCPALPCPALPCPGRLSSLV